MSVAKANILQETSAQPFDIIFINNFDQTEIPAHRMVMSASSKYFEALLGPHYKEGTENKITLSINGVTLKAIIDYCYTGRIEIHADNADDILDAASRVELIALEETVGQFWCDNLNLENCIEKLTKADKYFLTNLWQKALQFCGRYFDKLPLPDMLNIDESILRKLLALDEVALTEEQIFGSVVKWLQQNAVKRAKFVPALLKLIRLKHISSQFLREKVEPFYREYGSVELVNDEIRIRANNDCDSIVLHRSTPTNILCACLTRSVVDDPQIAMKMYDFNSNQWTHLDTIPLPPYERVAQAGISNGKIFTVCFLTTWHFNALVSLYDLDSFEHKSSTGQAVYRKNYAPVGIGRYIYVFGGIGSSGAELNSCECFDTELKEWEERQSMPTKTQIDAALELNGKIYAVRSGSLLCYDPDSDEWTTKSANENMNNAKVSSLYKKGSFLYVAEEGGNTHRFDTLNNTWTMLGCNEGPNILCTIQHHGLTYTLRRDGAFASEKLDTLNSKTSLKTINDVRISKCSFASLNAVKRLH